MTDQVADVTWGAYFEQHKVSLGAAFGGLALSLYSFTQMALNIADGIEKGDHFNYGYAVLAGSAGVTTLGVSIGGFYKWVSDHGKASAEATQIQKELAEKKLVDKKLDDLEDELEEVKKKLKAKTADLKQTGTALAGRLDAIDQQDLKGKLAALAQTVQDIADDVDDRVEDQEFATFKSSTDNSLQSIAGQVKSLRDEIGAGIVAPINEAFQDIEDAIKGLSSRVDDLERGSGSYEAGVRANHDQVSILVDDLDGVLEQVQGQATKAEGILTV